MRIFYTDENECFQTYTKRLMYNNGLYKKSSRSLSHVV